MIVSEYALSPCVFDQSAYESTTICALYLKSLKENLLHEEALIRNLYNGKWLQYVKNLPTKHANTKYILDAFIKNKYLRPVKSARANNPTSLEE
ncbi:hypothetical protein IQ219_05570 [Synechocystis sp. LEGE 06083]|uniref:hypothetical protein n=1 Tax=Synechocystis sp. LEGE 06083 TaxID=915336 RepID=UPI00187E8463|nr:hypothetical protein [Synechocystis sp. LEGE 06083]MBE9194787.1 hypothetical protein [Synechocystis sp. LEGE 06083]